MCLLPSQSQVKTRSTAPFVERTFPPPRPLGSICVCMRESLCTCVQGVDDIWWAGPPWRFTSDLVAPRTVPTTVCPVGRAITPSKPCCSIWRSTSLLPVLRTIPAWTASRSSTWSKLWGSTGWHTGGLSHAQWRTVLPHSVCLNVATIILGRNMASTQEETNAFKTIQWAWLLAGFIWSLAQWTTGHFFWSLK